MRWRNGDDGYGVVTKVLHWVIVALMTVQFAIGYRLDGGSSGRGRGRGRGEGSGRGRGRGGDYEIFGDDGLLTAHVVIGFTILVLASVRLTWRLVTPLPGWAPTLSGFERSLAHWTERSLYGAMFLVPLTGIYLVRGDDDLIGFHVGAHVLFFGALALHVGLMIKHALVNRDRLVRRML